MWRRTHTFVEFGGRVEPIVCSSATPPRPQLPRELLEIAPEIAPADVFEHADADDAVVLAVVLAIVLRVKLDARPRGRGARLRLARDAQLFRAQRQPGDG